MDDNNVFLERDPNDDQNDTEYTVSKKDILKSIPKNAFDKSNKTMATTMTEWRWRIFRFSENKETFIEISFKKPDETRKYINGDGIWVERNIGNEFDSFVILEKYAYT